MSRPVLHYSQPGAKKSPETPHPSTEAWRRINEASVNQDLSTPANILNTRVGKEEQVSCRGSNR